MPTHIHNHMSEALTTITNCSQLFESSVAKVEGIKCSLNVFEKSAELSPTTHETQLISP